MKNFLGLKKISVHELCLLGLLTALTVILAIFFTIRLGNAIKIPLKFITVFITSAIFGPLWGGLVGALGDILNSLLVPVGAPIPLITVIEFVYGFIFGLFFYCNNNRYIIKSFICSVVLTVIDILVVSLILTSVGYFPDYYVAMAVRLPASILKLVIYVIVILFLKRYLCILEGRLKK